MLSVRRWVGVNGLMGDDEGPGWLAGLVAAGAFLVVVWFVLVLVASL